MANQKKLIRIVALIEIEASNENDVAVIGGNIARLIQGNIPTQYNVKGVELEAVEDVGPADEVEVEKDTNIRAQRRGASEAEVESKSTPILKT